MGKLGKNVKKITTGGMEGEWDPKRRKLSANLPVGVTEIRLSVEGIDGVHKMDFSTFECTGSYISWKDYDYPALSKDYMLQRENRRQGRKPYEIFSTDYPRMRNITRFENPTRPPFLKGGQRPMRGRSYSPAELRYQPHQRRVTVSLSPPRYIPTPSRSSRTSRSASPSPAPRPPQPSMGVGTKRKRAGTQVEDALPSTSTANQNDPKDTPHRSITTSGPLLRDILPGEVPLESPDSRENHVLSLPMSKGGAGPLMSSDPTLMMRELTASDLEFIWILSMWINTKEELDKLALSLHLDLNRVDNALRIWPDYNHACRYLLIEWFLKASLRLTLPCLRVAFHSLGKAKEIDTFISRSWFLRDLKENIVPLCQPPRHTRFLLELTKLINSRDNISNLQLVVSCLELNAERVTALRVFFPWLFTAVAYFNLEDWCRQYDDHHSLTDQMEALHSMFIHMGKEKDFLNILTSHYPWFIPVEPECKRLHIQSPLTHSRSHSPSKSTPVTKPLR